MYVHLRRKYNQYKQNNKFGKGLLSFRIIHFFHSLCYIIIIKSLNNLYIYKRSLDKAVFKAYNFI